MTGTFERVCRASDSESERRYTGRTSEALLVSSKSDSRTVSGGRREGGSKEGRHSQNNLIWHRS